MLGNEYYKLTESPSEIKLLGKSSNVLAQLSINGTFGNVAINDLTDFNRENDKMIYRSDKIEIFLEYFELNNSLILKVGIRALEKQKIDGRVHFKLCPEMPDCFLFLPTNWAFMDRVDKFDSYEDFYPLYTIEDGYSRQIRTPALTVWNHDEGITAGVISPKPVELSVINNKGVIDFSIPFSKTSFGPDCCLPTPVLEKDETLEYEVFISTHGGDYKDGMRTWAQYVKKYILKDNFPEIAWTKEQNMHLAQWSPKVDKLDVDRMAELGIGMFEVLPWTAPEKEVIDYAHSKGIKVLMEHQMLSYYEVREEDKFADIKDDNLRSMEIARPHYMKVHEDHPDWTVILKNGDVAFPDRFYHFDPNVKAFRDAKVKEAVDAVEQGYDGIRYDNALIFNCYSDKHEHTMTFSEALMEMLREIKAAVRKINPEAAIFVNSPGPDLISIADMCMNEGGLCRSDFLCEQIDEAEDTSVSNYALTMARYRTLECISDMMGQKKCTWDYIKLSKKITDHYTAREITNINRSAIFNVMTGSISGFGNATGFRHKEYTVAQKIHALAGEPLTEIIEYENISYRIMRPGVIMLIETIGEKFSGTLTISDETWNKLKKHFGKSMATYMRDENGEQLLDDGVKAEIKLQVKPHGYAIIIFKKKTQYNGV